MLLETILDILRTDYGLSATTYDNAMLTRMINKAVKTISEYYPLVEIGHINTVAGQTRYTVTDSNLIKLKQVYYTQESTSLFNDPEIKTNLDISSSLSTFYPSQTVELIQRLDIIRKLNPKDAEIVAADKFDLIPTPTSVVTVYYEYEKYRTITEIPDMFEDDLINLVFYKLGDKTFKESAYLQGGNKYNFDRRGNISVDKETVDGVKNRNSAYNEIIKSIKLKVMKL